jgi:hypothetical protein
VSETDWELGFEAWQGRSRGDSRGETGGRGRGWCGQCEAAAGVPGQWISVGGTPRLSLGFWGLRDLLPPTIE